MHPERIKLERWMVMSREEVFRHIRRQRRKESWWGAMKGIKRKVAMVNWSIKNVGFTILWR